MEKSCSNCKFMYKKERFSYSATIYSTNAKSKTTYDLECRRNPPLSKGDSTSSFPKVLGNSWCGEWKPEEAYLSAALINIRAELINKGCPIKFSDISIIETLSKYDYNIKYAVEDLKSAKNCLRKG